MSKRVVNIGSAPNDGTGDSLRNGMDKINENFAEIYNTFGNGTTLEISSIGDAGTLDGQDGSYYLNYNNFTNTPNDLAVFNNSVGFVTASVVTGYATETYVTNALVGYATETFVNTGLALKANLTGANFTGVVTATQFVGDGSGLSGISAIGSGVEIEDDGSPVGTAATINFGSNVTVAISAGIATVDVQVSSEYFDSNPTGIHTLSNVGIGTTNAESTLTVSGDVSITGVTTITGNYFYVGNPDVTSNLTSGVVLDTSGKITHQSVGGETHIVGYAGSSASYALSKDGNLYLGGGNPDDGGTGGNITILGETSRIGIGSTLPTSALTVKGNTSLETLNVSGISTLNGLLISNDGGNNGSVLIEDTGAYSQISFRASNGITQAQIQGVESNLYINSGSSGYTALSSPTGNIFWPNGNVVLNNGNQGTTLIRNQVHVQSGITSFYDDVSVDGNVSVGGTISVDGGVTLATNNATIVGTSGTTGEIKQIGGAPFFYDGSAWREFVLSAGTPVSVPADTDWDNVILRNTFDTSFDDAKFSVSPIAVGSGSTIVSSPLKVGTKSFRNDGTAGAGISFAYRSEYDFTGPWTIEFWVYHDAAALNGQYLSLVSMTNSSSTSGEWSFGLYSNGSNQYWLWDNENNGTNKTLEVVSNATFNSTYLNQWVHYALVREADNGSIHFYINGVESSTTTSDGVIDNNILDISGSGLQIGGVSSPTINGAVWNSGASIDAFIDDLRISTIARYTSIGISTYATFTPSTTALPTTGTLSSYVAPPGDKYGEITLGGSPTWRGTSGVTVTQQSSGNYRVSFASTYTNANDYFVLSQGMDQGFASYVGIARSTTHVDFSINKQSDDTAVDTGSLSVQITNHI